MLPKFVCILNIFSKYVRKDRRKEGSKKGRREREKARKEGRVMEKREVLIS